MYIAKTSALVPLSDACRDAHEALAETVQKQIEKRTAAGIPLDDGTDFAHVEQRAADLVAACQEMDGAAAADIAAELASACTGGLRPLAPYEPVPDYEGVSVRLRAVSERFRIDIGERIAACKTLAEQRDVLAEYVAHAYDEVVGLEDDDGPVVIKAEGGRIPAEQMAVLDAAGLISDLWAVARRYAELPASKKKHFGSHQPSASAISDATAAQRNDVGSSDATVVPRGAIGSPNTSQTPAPGGTC